MSPVILSGVDTVGLVEKVTSDQRPEGGDRGGKVGMWQRVSRWREQPVQRPWWEKVAGVLEEQQGGPCGWSRVSEAGSWDSKVRPGGNRNSQHTGPCGRPGFGSALESHGRALSRGVVWSDLELYDFPIAVVATHHKLSGLHPRECILLRFWRPEVQSQFHWAKVKVSPSWFLLDDPGENHFLVFSSFWKPPALLGP